MRGEECGERHRGGEFASSHWHDIHGVLQWNIESKAAITFRERRSFLKQLTAVCCLLTNLSYFEKMLSVYKGTTLFKCRQDGGYLAFRKEQEEEKKIRYSSRTHAMH